MQASPSAIRESSVPPGRKGRLRVLMGVTLVLVFSSIATIVVTARGATTGVPPVPLTGARVAALANAATSCPTLSGARLAGQVMATTGFEATPDGGVVGLTAAEWELWKPWDGAARDDEAANLLALAHLTCNLVGHLRVDGYPGDLWPMAVAALRSSLADVRAAADVPAGVAGFVKQVQTYASEFDRFLEPDRPPAATSPASPSDTTATTGPDPTGSPAPTAGGPTVAASPSSTRPALAFPPASAPPVVLAFARFTDGSGLHLNGSARVGDGKLQLTTGLGQAGSAWTSTRVDTSKSFVTSFTAKIDVPTDGVAFVIQAEGPTALGGIGGGIGYGGEPDGDPANRIRPSIAVEIDTWDNSPDGYDPAGQQHLALTLNGDVTNHTAWGDPGFEMRFGLPVFVWVSYDGPTHRLAVFASQTDKRPAGALFSHYIDLKAHLGADLAYVGFTGSTGLTNLTESRESVLTWSFASS